MQTKLTSDDEKHLRRALELAQAGIGLASPNPYVGAVVCDSTGKVAGEGTHKYEDKLHAEIVALNAAGDKARGGILYLNLEPCCTTGRTGPCTGAIVTSGIKRLVAAMQ